ncbi:MAG: DUF1801 domain-containing protein [Nocardioidaceae bacterium]
MPQHQAVAVEQWLANLEPPARAEVEEVGQVVTEADPRMERAVKWGRLTYSLEGHWHHWLCAVAVSKRATRLVFHKGVLLEDRSGLLDGSGRYVREMQLAAALRHREDVTALVRSAVQHETDMLD